MKKRFKVTVIFSFHPPGKYVKCFMCSERYLNCLSNVILSEVIFITEGWLDMGTLLFMIFLDN